MEQLELEIPREQDHGRRRSQSGGKGAAEAFLAAGAVVVAMARNVRPLSELAAANRRLNWLREVLLPPLSQNSRVIVLSSGARPSGRPAVIAYAAREGLGEEEYLARLGDPVTAALAGEAFVKLATERQGEAGSYLLTADALREVSGSTSTVLQPVAVDNKQEEVVE